MGLAFSLIFISLSIVFILTCISINPIFVKKKCIHIVIFTRQAMRSLFETLQCFMMLTTSLDRDFHGLVYKKWFDSLAHVSIVTNIEVWGRAARSSCLPGEGRCPWPLHLWPCSWRRRQWFCLLAGARDIPGCQRKGSAKAAQRKARTLQYK